jgi:hypothetical protein
MTTPVTALITLPRLSKPIIGHHRVTDIEFPFRLQGQFAWDGTRFSRAGIWNSRRAPAHLAPTLEAVLFILPPGRAEILPSDDHEWNLMVTDLREIVEHHNENPFHPDTRAGYGFSWRRVIWQECPRAAGSLQ